MNWKSFNWPRLPLKWSDFKRFDEFNKLLVAPNTDLQSTVDCRPQTVLRFRCAYCGTIRRITEAGVSELKGRSAWKCEECASTSLELQGEERKKL